VGGASSDVQLQPIRQEKLSGSLVADLVLEMFKLHQEESAGGSPVAGFSNTFYRGAKNPLGAGTQVPEPLL
jgi:hypothetical protein